MSKLLAAIKRTPELLYLGLIALLGFLFLQNKKKADILEREAAIKDIDKDIAVHKERLKHEEEQANDAVDDYERAKSTYRKGR